MLLDQADVLRLREALVNAGYTTEGIAERLGPAGSEAAARNDFREALRRTAGGDPLDTLIRLFVVGQAEPEAAIARALKPLTLEKARRGGIVNGDEAGVDLEPYGRWWVMADLPAEPGRPLPADHVLGVGGASTTLTNATIRRPVGSALDLGTGCGVQALHLKTHAQAVTATDLSKRALAFAAVNATLNGLDWELRRGDMTEAVEGRRFDLVVSNPPFVVGPGTATHTYRDSGRAGDNVCAELAAAAAGLLNPGGTMQFLANWIHVKGEDWEDRVAGWFAGSGLDVWAIQREVQDPLDYVRLWLADASEPDDPIRAAGWLDWLEAHDVSAVGFGLITARASGHDDPVVVCEDLRQQVSQPMGERVAQWFDRREWLRRNDLLASTLRLAPGLQLRQEASFGAGEGWAVDRQLLALTDGLRWVEEIDPLILAVVSGCDGTIPLSGVFDLLAAAHGVPPDDLKNAMLPVVDHLVERGMLAPCEP
ncbi:MAG TPA: methyltransferase [Candidatus Limnocylindrales bacterium]